MEGYNSADWDGTCHKMGEKMEVTEEDRVSCF